MIRYLQTFWIKGIGQIRLYQAIDWSVKYTKNLPLVFGLVDLI